jgi:hypothetical protein
MHRDLAPHRYEICVRGHLGEMICSGFPDLRARTRGEDTVLTGMFADQAALYGVLAEVEALGLELIEVRRLPPHQPNDLDTGMLRRLDDESGED